MKAKPNQITIVKINDSPQSFCGYVLPQNHILEVLEKSEKENEERLTKLADSMISQAVSSILRSQVEHDNKIAQMACIPEDCNETISDSGHDSHQQFWDFISERCGIQK
jgi:hypothetical protein